MGKPTRSWQSAVPSDLAPPSICSTELLERSCLSLERENPGSCTGGASARCRQDFRHDALDAPVLADVEQALQHGQPQTLPLERIGHQQRELGVARSREPRQPADRDDLQAARPRQVASALRPTPFRGRNR